MNETIELFKFVDDAETLVNPCFIGVPKVMKSVTSPERIAKVLGVPVERIEAIVDATIEDLGLDASDRTNDNFLRGMFKAGKGPEREVTLISGVGLRRISIYLSGEGVALDDDESVSDGLWEIRNSMQYADMLRYNESGWYIAAMCRKAISLLKHLYPEGESMIESMEEDQVQMLEEIEKLRKKNKKLKKMLRPIGESSKFTHVRVIGVKAPKPKC